MTVAELIAKLQAMPGDSRVVVDGYEGGVSDVATVEATRLRLNVNDRWYYGDHEESAEGEAPAVRIGAS